MKTFMFRLPSQIAACVAAAGFVLVASVCAQTVSAPPVTAPSTEVPDGSPQLAPEKVISNTSKGTTGSSNPGRSASAAGSVIVNEERIQGRLASAHVSVGGTKGYTIVDPDAGRTDRQSGNGGKRLTPSTWELFRF